MHLLSSSPPFLKEEEEEEEEEEENTTRFTTVNTASGIQPQPNVAAGGLSRPNRTRPRRIAQRKLRHFGGGERESRG